MINIFKDHRIYIFLHVSYMFEYHDITIVSCTNNHGNTKLHLLKLSNHELSDTQ